MDSRAEFAITSHPTSEAGYPKHRTSQVVFGSDSAMSLPELAEAWSGGSERTTRRQACRSGVTFSTHTPYRMLENVTREVEAFVQFVLPEGS